MIKLKRNNPSNYQSIWKKSFNQLQKIGKSLLFPITMLPFAAIFLRLGVAIPTTTGFSSAIHGIFLTIGNGVFGNLSILFAVGIAFGLAKDNRGESAIVGLVVMIILNILVADGSKFKGVDFVDKIYGGMILNGNHGFHGLFSGDSYNSILADNVFTGIFAGSLVAYIYNRFNAIELPSILGFFSGRRLVPVLSMIGVVIFGLLYSIIFPWFGAGLFYVGKAMGEAQSSHWGNAGVMGAYGFINRLLIPFGLHHVINIPLWFSSIGGTQDGIDGVIIDGDINIFATAPALGNHAGTFQTGFFPIMMFGLPAITAAIYYNAKGHVQKTRVFSLFAGSALVSFFTGITEPLEFAFMFTAPALYGIHVLLTGVFGFIVGAFGIQLGFGFSAGLIDYVLSIPKSLEIIKSNKSGFEAVMANPIWIWVIGAAAASTYFFLGNFMIKKMNLDTPGRGNNLIEDGVEVKTKNTTSSKGEATVRSKEYVKALGGYDNITMFSHCATRLRYDIKDMTKVDPKALKKAGAFGSKEVSNHHIHVIIGQAVEILNNEIVAGSPKK